MTEIEKYFMGEKLQCSIGIGFSLLSIVFALYFLWHSRSGFYKGVAYPFLIVGLLLFIICTGVVLRTSEDISRVTRYAQQEPEKLVSEEIPRMKKVMKNFKGIKTVEICIALISICLLLFSGNHQLLKGIGLGLLIQSILMYGFDHFAENRGEVYWIFLQS